MSWINRYDTGVQNLGAILQATRPKAAPAAQPAPDSNVYTSQTAGEAGQATVAVGRHNTERASRLDEHTTALLGPYAVGMALSRQAVEDPPLFRLLLAEGSYPVWPGGEGGN